jgi:hypothetical protein
LIVLPLLAMTSQPAFETKIAIIVREDLPTWQKLNLTAFLASGVTHLAPEAVGEPYADADGTKYAPMLGQPVLVFGSDAAGLTRSLERALSRGIVPAVYTEELFATGNDVDNRAAVAAVARAELNLVGLALRGPRRDVDKITKELVLHR